MNILSSITKMFLALVIAAGLASCDAGNSPEGVAESFLDAVKNGNYDVAKDYATEDTQEDVVRLAEGPRANEGKDFEVLNVQDRTDSTATVIYKWEGGDERQLDLVNENGNWKVKFSKEMDDINLDQYLQEEMEGMDIDTSDMEMEEVPEGESF